MGWHSEVQAATAAKSLQSCLTLYDPIDRSPSGSSVPGILQARTLEWVAISFCNLKCRTGFKVHWWQNIIYDILFPSFISLVVLIHLFFSQHTLLHVFLYFLLIAFLLLGLYFLSVLFLLSSWNGSFACKQNERKFARWMIWIAVNTEGCFFPGNSAGKESLCNSGDLSMLPVVGSSPGEKG